MKTQCISILAAAAIFLLGPSGCSCTQNIVVSTRVKVADAGGAVVTDATVTYCVDGGTEKACSGSAGAYICGVEEDGDFTITARKGMLSKTVEVTVDADYCHVETQSFTITLGA
jgi:hypothetical protein